MTETTVPTAADSETLLIVVDWYSDSWDHPVRGLCGRYSCGHFSSPCGLASSQWDFPADTFVCSTCHQEVQFDLRLQGALYAQYTTPESEWPAIPTEDQTAIATEA